LVTVKVGPHPHFRRRGNELYVNVPVTLQEAVLGGKVDVPTPKGMITLKIPPGTSSGKRLRIRQQGVPGKDGARGDLFAEIQIVLPSQLSSEFKELVQKTGGSYTENPRRDLRW
jgi:curved DNA-binding protein